MMHAWKPLSLPHGAAFAAVLLLAAVPAPAALAASAVGHVSVTILPAAAGVGGGAMSFGTGSSPVPVRVALGPSGQAGGPAVYSSGGWRGAGSLTLTGSPGTPVTLSLSAGDLAHGPGAPMPFRVVAVSAGALSVIDRSGTVRLALGATLSVGQQQAPGAYHGDYTVTVDY